jgi:hypothetical protein
MAKTPAPILSGFHFPTDGLHFAEYIEAETLEAATATYHKIKRLISPAVSTPMKKPEEKVLE